MLLNFKVARESFENKSIIPAIQVKAKKAGQDKIHPKNPKIMPKIPKAKIKMVMGAKNGTINILIMGEIKDMQPKL